MGAKTTEKGGENVMGLSKDFISALQSLLNTGGMGSGGSPDAMGTTGGIAGILQSILSPGAGKLGGNLMDILNKDTERGANALRSRFSAGGGTSLGTPAAYAEGLYRGEAASRNTSAIGDLQMGAIGQLLPLLAGFAGKGVTQRQLVQEPSTFGQIASVVAPIASAALPFLSPAFGAIGGAAASMGATGLAPVGGNNFRPFSGGNPISWGS